MINSENINHSSWLTFATLEINFALLDDGVTVALVSYLESPL